MKKTEFFELRKCYKDPWYFLTKYVTTIERSTGPKQFPDHEYLKNLIYKFESSPRLVILKSRQMMVTWTAVAYSLWEAIFRGNTEILFLSKREDDAKEAIKRAKFILEKLPDPLQTTNRIFHKVSYRIPKKKFKIDGAAHL